MELRSFASLAGKIFMLDTLGNLERTHTCGELRESDVAALERSAEPALRLTAWALRARRGERVDLDDARAAWAGLPERERARHAVQAALIPGIEAR